MIIKNISPYPKAIGGLNIKLMPGQEVDISKFEQKQRDECFDLQEGFRKGELVCIGIGRQDKGNLTHEQRAQRAFANGSRPNQNTIRVERTFKMDVMDEWEQPHAAAAAEQPLTTEYKSTTRYGHNKRPKVEEIEQIDGIVEISPQGGAVVRSFDKGPPPPPMAGKRKEHIPVELRPIEHKEISKERARELLRASQCISFCKNGRRCRSRPVTGYEYCFRHMPEDVEKEYKEKKKQAFFKD